jgi:death on curing protein
MGGTAKPSNGSRSDPVEPTFLTLDEIIAIHHDQIARYGGSEGVRDWGLLQSAIAMPSATYGGRFLHSDLCEMAAAYVFHIVQDHPLIDGNKRVGTVAAYVFLALNNMRLEADEDSYASLVLSVARGETSKSAVAEFFRANAAPS